MWKSFSTKLYFLYGYKISLICEKYERIVIDTRDFTLQLYAKVFIEALKVFFQGWNWSEIKS